MKSLLLTVGLGLVTPLQATWDDRDISGKWYLKAFGSQTEMPMNDRLPVTFSVLGNGNVQSTLTHRIQGQCLEVHTTLERTEVPGRYSIFEGQGDLLMERSAVKDHLMLLLQGEVGGKNFVAANLMGRKPEENPEALEDFKKFMKRQGLLQEKVFTSKPTEECVP